MEEGKESGEVVELEPTRQSEGLVLKGQQCEEKGKKSDGSGLLLVVGGLSSLERPDCLRQRCE